MKVLVASGMSIVETKENMLQEEGMATSIDDYQAKLLPEPPEDPGNEKP